MNVHCHALGVVFTRCPIHASIFALLNRSRRSVALPPVTQDSATSCKLRDWHFSSPRCCPDRHGTPFCFTGWHNIVELVAVVVIVAVVVVVQTHIACPCVIQCIQAWACVTKSDVGNGSAAKELGSRQHLMPKDEKLRTKVYPNVQ